MAPTLAGFAEFIWTQLFYTPQKPTEDRTDQIAIVTGSNTGLGLEAARHLLRQNAALVILAVRSTSKGESAAASLINNTPHLDPAQSKSRVQVWPLDLSSYASVKAFAERVEALPRLDAVIENAGIASAVFKKVVNPEDGGEPQEAGIVTNVISTFLLAWSVLPKLRETGVKQNKRTNLVIVASEVHGWAEFVEKDVKGKGLFEALADEGGSNMMDRYQVTKLLEVLYLPELVAHLPSSFTDTVILNLVTPGLCQSELNREGSRVVEVLKFLLARTTEVGARTLIHASEGGEETQGKYIMNCKVRDAEGLAAGPGAEDLRRRVWGELNEKLERIQPGVTKLARS